MDRPGRIFVGGLSREGVDEKELERVFSKFGNITEVSVRREKRAPKSEQTRGFAFITFENPADSEEAIRDLNGQEFKGKMIHVDHTKSTNGGSPRRGGGSFRGGSRGGGYRDSARGGSRGVGGFRGRGGPRSDRGGRGRGRDFGDRPPRDSYDDDRRGPPSKSFPPRRESFDRGYGSRDTRGAAPPRRDDDRERFGGAMSRDRFGSAPERRPRDPYPPSPPRVSLMDSRTGGGSYRDFPSQSRDYSPPPPRDYGRERAAPREYSAGGRDMPPPSRNSFGSSGRDAFPSSRESFPPRDEYSRDFPASSRDYPREPVSRDYGPPRDSGSRGAPRDFERGMERGFDRSLDRAPPSREYSDSYRDSGRPAGPPTRSFAPSAPRDGPMSRSSAPPSRSSYGSPSARPLMGPERGDRDRGRAGEGGYSVGSRRPAPFDSRAGPGPAKRSRPDGPPMRDGPMRSSPRDGPPSRGPPRDGPPRGPSRDGPPRGGPPPFRR